MFSVRKMDVITVSSHLMARVAATCMRAMEFDCDNNRHEASRIFHFLPAMITMSQSVVGCIFPTRHRYRCRHAVSNKTRGMVPFDVGVDQ